MQAQFPRAGDDRQLPERFNFTGDVVEALASTTPRGLALAFVDDLGVIDRRTFAQIAAGASRWAALLRRRGLVPGDRVLVHLGRTPDWHNVLLGALKAGLVAVPCREGTDAHDLAFRGEHSDAQLVVSALEREPELSRVDVPVEIVFVEEVAEELLSMSVVQPTDDTAAEDLAYIVYTHRASGGPRGVVHTHGHAWASRLPAEDWLDARPGDLVWCSSEAGSAQSIWNSLLGPFSRGAAVVVHRSEFDPEQRLDLVERLGVTILCQTPAEYEALACVSRPERFDVGRIRHAVSTGEALDPGVVDAFRSAFGITVRDGYGVAETGVVVGNMPGTPSRSGSIGVPLPGCDVSIVDADGSELPPGVEGDIALGSHAPSLFVGYWEAPGETEAVFRGPWYLTGDRATRDEEGCFWLSGQVNEGPAPAAPEERQLDAGSDVPEHAVASASKVAGKRAAKK